MILLLHALVGPICARTILGVDPCVFVLLLVLLPVFRVLLALYLVQYQVAELLVQIVVVVGRSRRFSNIAQIIPVVGR